MPYTRNHRLVRGLDYYTRTTFEFTHGGLGAQNALLGGGRYDGLSEAIGGPKAPGIGFAMGEDRLVLTLQALEADQKAAADRRAGCVYRAARREPERRRAGAGARTAPRRAAASNWATAAFGSRSRLRPLTRLRARIVILGEDELQSGILTVKDFATGIQTKVPRAELAAFLVRT